MKFLAPTAYVTSAVTSAEGETCRVDNGSVRRHNRIAWCRRRAKSIDNVVRLRRVRQLKLCGLKLGLKRLDLVLGDCVDNPLHSGGLVLNHITEAVVHGVLKDVGLRRHIVVDFALPLFQIAAAVSHLGAKSIESITQLSADILDSALNALGSQRSVDVRSGREALSCRGVESTSAISAEAAAKAAPSEHTKQQEENDPPTSISAPHAVISAVSGSGGNIG